MRQLAKEASTSNTLIPNRKEEAKEDSKEKEEEGPETNREKCESEEKEERSLERKEDTKKQVKFFFLQYASFFFELLFLSFKRAKA